MQLPIDPLIPEMVRHLRTADSLVIEAAPGAGKTTRVPRRSWRWTIAKFWCWSRAASLLGLRHAAEWEERVRFAGQHGLDSPVNPAQAALRALAFGLKSFAELEAATRDRGLLREMERQLPAGTRQALEEVAPAKVRLAGGREVKVHYERDAPPWVQSRLQDFFGMHETPAVARGKVPVVVRLLAPNQRPVQMTTDLAGFWERLYPSIRRELMRRYPKHKWPERPV